MKASRWAATAFLAAAPLLHDGTPLAGQLIPADPQISPDGRWVAYIVHDVDEETGEAYSNLALVATGSRRTDRLTDGLRIDRTPRFSPDSRSLAWVTFVDGFWELRVRTLDTRQTRELAVGSQPHGGIAWSPQGDRIAYTRLVRQFDEETGPVHLFTVSPTGGRPSRISREGFHSGGIELGTHLSWTPEGDAIVLAANPGGDLQLYEISIATGIERVLAAHRGPDRDPAISPDGQFVAYTGHGGLPDEGIPDRLFVAERVGVAFPRVLSRTVEHSVRHPAWTADGGSIFAIIEGPRVDRLALFRIDGSYRIVADSLDRPADVLGETWIGSERFSVTADSVYPKFAVTTSHPDRPPEVGVGGNQLTNPVRALSSLNSALADRGLPELEEIGDADAPPLGWALRPADAGLEAPAAIVDLRTDGVTSPARFDMTRQALVAAGYVVLIPAADESGGNAAMIANAAALGWIDPNRVFGLGSHTGTGQIDISPRPVEPDSPFRAIIDWGEASFERTAARIDDTLEWLTRQDSENESGGAS
ncbi:MAG: TolB family protein [Gemmatimonadota bacterium]